MADSEGKERRKAVLTEMDVEALCPEIAEWLLADDRYLDRLTSAIEAKLWESWYQELGKIALRASLYVVGTALVALAGWLWAIGKIT